MYFICIEILPHHGFSKNTELVTIKLVGTHRLCPTRSMRKYFKNEIVFAILNPLTRFYKGLQYFI